MTRDHPAVASAKRAIRRGLSDLTPAQLFQIAAAVDTLRFGRDRGQWGLSVSYAVDHPEHRWKCDVQKPKGGAR